MRTFIEVGLLMSKPIIGIHEGHSDGNSLATQRENLLYSEDVPKSKSYTLF